MIIIQVLTGLVLLTFGRRLFWFFMGVLGFLAGFTLASSLFKDQAYQVTLVIAIVFGVLGIILALTIQKVALVVAGFIAGGYLAYLILNSLGYENVWLWLGVFLVFGAIGAALMALLFNAALLLMTSVTGAVMVTRSLGQVLPLQNTMTVVIFLALLAVGIAIQVAELKKG